MDPEPVTDHEDVYGSQGAEQAELQQAYRDQVVAPRVAACVSLHCLSCIAAGQSTHHALPDQQAAGK